VVVVFVTSSDIEASVVMALLDSHGIKAIRASGNTQGIWPMAVSALGEIKVGVADALFHQYPTYDEGQKSKIKAAVVSTTSLARHAEILRLGEHLILGRGEEKTGGRFKQALLADAYEALIAAIYLDGGLEAAEAFLRRELKDALDEGSAQTFARDYKSALQEQLQALGHPLPDYRVSGETGPDHRKTFSVEVVVGGEVLGAATGRAKKEAEQEAAREALARLASIPDSAPPKSQPLPTPNIQLLPTPKDSTSDE